MAVSPAAANIYAKQLICKGLGLPLWQPEPTRFGEVLIGDVGFVQGGQFFRLFNVTRPESDPLNRWGVPEGFLPLEYDEDALVHANDQFLSPGAIYNGQSMSCRIQVGASGGV